MFSLPVIIAIFVISFLLLTRASALLVSSLTMLARIFQMSEYAIAFILMSMATSVSELFVGISSAVNGIPELSLGNVFGANILDITLAIGIPALLAGTLTIESKIERSNFWSIFFLSLFPFLLGFDGVISRGDGIVLILLFIFYLILIARDKEYFSKIYNNVPRTGEAGAKTTFKNTLLLLLGIFMLVIASAVLVWSAKQISIAFAIETLTIGIVFIALGTTLPELIFGVRAAYAGHPSMTVGNALGSIAFNSSFIVGFVSILQPIHIPNVNEFVLVLAALAIGFLLFNSFMYRENDITKKEAIILIALYIIFISTELICRSCSFSLFSQ